MLFSSLRPLHSSEKRVLFAVILLHVLAITLPYLWAANITPPGFAYSGLLFSPDDQNVHLAWARQAADGHFFMRDLFTTESLLSGERPLFFNALCALMGVLSRTGAPLIFVYHAMRVLFAIWGLLAFYALSTHLTDDRRVRLVALILAAFSGGGSYLAPFFHGRNFIDRPYGQGFPMMPEAFTFASSFIYILNIAALALLLTTYISILRAQEAVTTSARRRALATGFFAAMLLSNIHTYDAIPLIVTVIIWTLWPQENISLRTRWGIPAFILLGALLPMLYQLFVFRNSDEFRIKALTHTAAPPLIDVLLSYGILIPLAIAGGVLLRRIKRRNTLLLVLWAVVTLACIYAPVSFARKMIEGLHLPLCLLAAAGLIGFASRLSTPILRRLVVAGALVLCCISSIDFMRWCAVENISNAPLYNQSRGVLMPPLYLTRGDARALQFLNEAVPEREKKTKVVLCWSKLGNYVPQSSGMYVYFGHWAETLHVKTKNGVPGKLEQTLNFYTGKMSPATARAWLKRNRIGYIVIGYYEKAQFDARLPLELPYVFNVDGTTIYAVP